MNSQVRPIVSPQNENFKMWKQLSTSKGIRKNGCFFLMGEKLIKEFLKKPGHKILAEVMGPNHNPLLEGRDFDRTPKYQTTKELFDEIDVIGTHYNLLLLECPEMRSEKLSNSNGLEVILSLGDPGNLGAVLRSAKAFGLKKIFLTEEACHPFHPKSIKASAGAGLDLNIVRTSSLPACLIEAPKNSYALDQGGTPAEKMKWPKNLFLFIGEEGPGLPGNKLPKITIPIQDVESLNAAVAAGIAFFTYRDYHSKL
jgi:RNA methyltransferase, TrmH family